MKYPGMIGLMIIAAIVFSGAVSALEGEEKPIPQTVCPITGGKINKDVYHDYQGKRTFFCCEGCIDKFARAPEKYIKKMEDEGITLAKAPVYQTLCPVMGGKINKELFHDYEGKRVYFCCAGCGEKFAKAPEKYIKKMEEAGIVLDKAPASKEATPPKKAKKKGG